MDETKIRWWRPSDRKTAQARITELEQRNQALEKKAERESCAMNDLLRFLGIDPETDSDALSEATYFACLKVLSESLGKLPLRLQRHTDKSGVVVDQRHPMAQAVCERPNPYMSAATFWAAVENNRNHYGNAYVWIEGVGDKTNLWLLPSESVEPWRDDTKALFDVPDVYYRVNLNGHNYTFGSSEILHFRTSNTLDGLKGVSVREQLAMTINGNEQAQQMLNKMYSSGFTAKAVLQYSGDLNDKNADVFISGIERYAKGELRSKGIENIIPVPLGTQLTPLNVKLADNQFLEIKQYSSLQIASAFGIKPYQIGDYTKSSYASSEQQQLSFYVDTLLFILKQYEEELSYKLLTDEERRSGYRFKFNVAAVLRADQKTQIDTLSAAVSNFLMTPNEARAELDLEAVNGGDKLLGNGASIPVDMTGLQYTKDTETDGKEG